MTSATAASSLSIDSGAKLGVVSCAVADHLKATIPSIGNWIATFSESARVRLVQPEIGRKIGQLLFIDGYFRIRQTTPLILAAIQTLDLRFDHENSRFWVHHLEDEYGHDSVMYRDIVAMLGNEPQAIEILRQTSMTPPSAAIIGFFDWQVRRDNPHLLMLLRLFLETVMANLSDEKAAAIHSLFPAGSETIRIHRDADQDHVGECYGYINRNFTEHDLPTLVWILDFVALGLKEAQSWVAAHVLGQNK